MHRDNWALPLLHVMHRDNWALPLLHVIHRDNWASSLYHSDNNIILYVNIMLDIILSVEYLHKTYTTFRELTIPHI
jgi:hypothetical protein